MEERGGRGCGGNGRHGVEVECREACGGGER